jgi:exoribonuclease R
LAQLPSGFTELADRIERAERARGADRVEAPEQELDVTPDGFELRFRPRSEIERQSAALSLATNMAVADTLYAAGTGLFRTMAAPAERHLGRLRSTARALRLEWPSGQPLAEFTRSLPAEDPRTGAFQLAVRRAGGGAGYEAFREGVVPWHAAVAATYCHATAPLRRLADRYVIDAVVAVVAGRPVPDLAAHSFEQLPDVMQRADALAGRVDRAALDVAEAVVLAGREGSVFDAVVTDQDDRGARIQIGEPAVVARVVARQVEPGDDVRVRLTRADAVGRVVQFERVS